MLHRNIWEAVEAQNFRICNAVHRCICVGLRGSWLSTSVGKTSVAILGDIYGLLFIGWN